MKLRRLFLTLLLIVFGICLSAQTSDDASRQKLPWRPPTGQDRFIVEFHNDGFLNLAPEMETRPYSPGINAHIFYDYPFAKKSIFSFAWGYGFSSFNVHHNGEFLEDSLKITQFVPFPKDYNYSKNKASNNFLEIPIELRIRTRGLRQFKMAFGAKAGYVVNVHTKIIDDGGKRKAYQIPNLMKYRYGLTAKIGVGRFMLHGFYSLTPFLEENNGPELIPFTLGCRVNLL